MDKLSLGISYGYTMPLSDELARQKSRRKLSSGLGRYLTEICEPKPQGGR